MNCCTHKKSAVPKHRYRASKQFYRLKASQLNLSENDQPISQKHILYCSCSKAQSSTTFPLKAPGSLMSLNGHKLGEHHSPKLLRSHPRCIPDNLPADREASGAPPEDQLVLHTRRSRETSLLLWSPFSYYASLYSLSYLPSKRTAVHVVRASRLTKTQPIPLIRIHILNHDFF